MRQFQNILYVCHRISEQEQGLKQALSLARNNTAAIKVLLVHPELPESFNDSKNEYNKFLLESITKSIYNVKLELKMSDSDAQVSIAIESGKTTAIDIIKYVLHGSHDLVVKEPENNEGVSGFKAIDMNLLRKCPCPVWLCHPISKTRDSIKVVVAIDPINTEQVGHNLAIKLLQTARTLADTCDGELNILSCWDYELEEYFLSSSWIPVSKEELAKEVANTKNHHYAKFMSVIKESGIQGKNTIHHIRGAADISIPKFINDNKLDILVMGTLAKTGIPGFIMGNTAEDILQKVRCSLLALKPDGFISPVEASG